MRRPICCGVLACAAGCLSSEEKVCTPPSIELGTCAKGVILVESTFKGKGAWVFEVEADGRKATCEATLPLPPQTGPRCTGDLNIIISVLSSGFRAPSEALRNIQISDSDAALLQVRVTRDGMNVGERMYALTYADAFLSAHPECEGIVPPSCRVARVRFP